MDIKPVPAVVAVAVVLFIVSRVSGSECERAMDCQLGEICQNGECVPSDPAPGPQFPRR